MLETLFKWAYAVICSNFFLSLKTMFLAKVYVSKQHSLFRQLHEYYSKGLGCLLQSPPVRSYTKIILSNPKVYICTDQDVITSEVLNNVILFYKMHKFTDFGTVYVFHSIFYCSNNDSRTVDRFTIDSVSKGNVRKINSYGP